MKSNESGAGSKARMIDKRLYVSTGMVRCELNRLKEKMERNYRTVSSSKGQNKLSDHLHVLWSGAIS